MFEVVLGVVILVAGILLMTLSSDKAVEHSIILASALGISPLLIGFTLVSIGTDLPEDCVATLGNTNSKIIYTLVTDLIENSLESDRLSLSRDVSEALKKLKQFNYEKIYLNPEIKSQSNKIQKIFRFLFETFLRDIQRENKSSWIFEHFLKKNEAKIH